MSESKPKTKNLKFKIILLVIIIGFSFIIFIRPIFALELHIVPDCAKTGDCTPEDFLKVFVNISKLILGLLGAIALMFFIYGGIILLTSGGGPDQIKKGQGILKGTVLGIIIVLSAWIIVFFIQETILKTEYRGRLVSEEVKGCCAFCPSSILALCTLQERNLITKEKCDENLEMEGIVGTTAEWHEASNYEECNRRIGELNTSRIPPP